MSYPQFTSSRGGNDAPAPVGVVITVERAVHGKRRQPFKSRNRAPSPADKSWDGEPIAKWFSPPPVVTATADVAACGIGIAWVRTIHHLSKEGHVHCIRMLPDDKTKRQRLLLGGSVNIEIGILG